MIRVLIVDDSVVIRRLVSKMIDDAPDMEVAAVAANGRIALARLEQTAVDAVTLDIEMPEMNGLETLREIRCRYPDLPVIMFSSLTQRGAEETLDALTLGANDYVTKPSGSRGLHGGIDRVREDLVPKIRALCTRRTTRPSPSRRSVAPRTAPPGTAPRAAGTAVRSERPAVEVVAIGVSTGGPNALIEIVPALPPEFSTPILIVQHMPPLFTRLLAERLDKLAKIAVREATHESVIAPGEALIAPGDYHMRVERRGTRALVKLDQGPPENSCRPAVDPLFRSCADVYGPGTLAIVLTGMGQDGMVGARAVVASGGSVLAQDEASSVVWGMPGAVIEADLACGVVPLGDVAAEISRRASGELDRLGKPS